MKTSLLLAGLLFSASATLAQVPGSVSGLTFNLTLTRTVEGIVQKDPLTGKPITGKDPQGNPLGGPAFGNQWTITKNGRDGVPVSALFRQEYVSKMLTEKYGNKELLIDLLDAGLLPGIADADPEIKGWTIVEVTGTVGGQENEPRIANLPTFYAYHAASNTAVLLSGEVIAIDLLVRGSQAESWTEQNTAKLELVQETEVVTFTSAGSSINLVRLSMDFTGVLEEGDGSSSLAQFQGQYSRQEKLTTVTAANKTKLDVFQCGPGKLESITGSGPLYGEDPEEQRAVIGGQWIAVAGKLWSDISVVFPEAAVEPPL